MIEDVEKLSSQFSNNIVEYKNDSYIEADVRAEFIDRFFEALGWDITNKQNLRRRYREVSREVGLHIEGQERRPDYEFRFGVERKFFVEAKKPAVDIAFSPEAAFQVRRYGWSAGLKISVLTNFEYLAIYDTTVKPEQGQPANHSRLYLFDYKDYFTKFNDIAKLLSRESVYSGLFDEQFSQQTQNRPSEAIDAVFLDQLNKWRLRLCEDIYLTRPNADESVLNEVSQLFILRILFLRMCEDRGITNYEQLKRTSQINDWSAFLNLLVESEQRFDSGLFDRDNDPFLSSQSIQLDSATVQYIVDSLYFPEAPYTFSVFEPEFLGSVYEQFLTQRAAIDDGRVNLVPKPEHVDRDVVATPRSIIERIVQDTLYPAIQSLDIPDILERKVLDPACGSGGFLISAFDVLMDAVTTAYLRLGDKRAIYETPNGWQLTFEEKCRILTSCIYGVDRDYAATEVTKFSLLVKLLENETPDSLPTSNRILPRLDRNIFYGDSLVDNRIYAEEPSSTTIGPPLTWGQETPGEYHCILGNPPYLKTEDMLNLENTEFRFYKRHYKSAFKQFDKYYLFIERSIKDLLAQNGILGMIVSRKFFNVQSGKNLRLLLSSNAYVSQIVDFGNSQLFQGRSTYTCLLYLSKKRPTEPLDDDRLLYEVVTTPAEWIKQQYSTRTSFAIPRYFISGDKEWVLPGTETELRLLQTMSQDSIPLGEIADVYTGIQTSCNPVYVITGWTEFDDSTISFNKLGRVWRIEKEILKPFFEERRGTLKSFYPLPTTAQVIYPYFIKHQGNRLRASIIPSEVMRTSFPLAYEWLNYNHDRLARRDIQPSHFPADEWYRYGRVQALTAFENRPKIVVGINSKGDKYVYDESNTLLASGDTAGECAISTFTDQPERSPYDLHFILALLNYKAVEYFCRKRGSSFQHGWYARGKSVLEQIPVPFIDLTTDNERKRLYDRIIRNCIQLSATCRSLTEVPTNAARVRLDRQRAFMKQALDTDISSLYGIVGIIDGIELPG